MHSFLSHALYTVSCLFELYTDKISVKNLSKKKKERKIKKTAQIGTVLWLAYLMPDNGLVVSLHPEGSATGQLDQGFP
jgi:hypothetical protein